MSDPAPSKTADVVTASRTELLIELPVSGVRAADLAQWVDRLLNALSSDGSTLVVRLTDDATMSRLNERYRRQPGPTDVLSFPGAATPEGPHLGDVVIALPTAARQADRAACTLESEVKRLILHGILHCLGYDHETDDGEMERLESQLRTVWVNSNE